MRQAYAHEAVVVLGPRSDPAAPGGAVTVELCGHWEHPPPCPFAPHHIAATAAATAADGDDGSSDSGTDSGALRLRVLFATEPADERRARAGIERALASGRATGPDGGVSTWTVRSCAPAPVRPDEAAHAARLAAS